MNSYTDVQKRWDHDLIIPFTSLYQLGPTPPKFPGTTCSTAFHGPEAVKGKKGPVNGRFALAWLHVGCGYQRVENTGT